MLGPVLALVSWTRFDEAPDGTFYEREFVSAIVPFASDFDEDTCYVNVWTSHNKEGRKRGLLYATLVSQDDRRDDILTAERFYFCETLADRLVVTDKVRQERYEEFRRYGTISARLRNSIMRDEVPTDGEESEAVATNRARLEAIRLGTPGVHADSGSDDNPTEGFPESLPEAESTAGSAEVVVNDERILVTSGVESNEWLYDGVVDTTGSEAQHDSEDEEGLEEYMIEELLGDRRREVALFASQNNISLPEAAKELVEESVLSLGRYLTTKIPKCFGHPRRQAPLHSSSASGGRRFRCSKRFAAGVAECIARARRDHGRGVSRS